MHLGWDHTSSTALSEVYSRYWFTAIHAHTHTHTRLTAIFPGLPRLAGTRKVKTNLDFTGARDSEWKWHQLGYMQVCTSLQTDNHASTPPHSFLQARCPSCRPTNSVKAWKADGSGQSKAQYQHLKKLKRHSTANQPLLLSINGDRQTDGWKTDRCIDPTPHTM